MKIIFLFIFIILGIILFGCTPKLDEETIKTISELEKSIDKHAEEEEFMGSILVAQDGRILVSKGFGMADRGKKIENKPETLYRIGSITKTFTAMGIMMLEERGLLSTEDPISKYIPDYIRGDDITIHNLLTHTSGIQDFVNFINFAVGGSGDFHLTSKKIVEILKDKPLNFYPGEDYEYCASNYALLGYIIEEVSGLSYKEYMEKNIFKPLKMKSTGVDNNDFKAEDKAKGYHKYNNAIIAAPYVDLSINFAGADMYSTVEDLYKWDQALYTDKLVRTDTLNKIFTPYMENYGYGWLINHIENNGEKQLIISHPGLTSGFTSRIIRNVDKKNTVIVLSNRYRSDFTPMIQDIYSILNK